MNKFSLTYQIFRNMGWKYFQFRMAYEIKRKSGLLKKKFPTKIEDKSFITLEEWKKLSSQNFFFASRKDLNIKKQQSEQLCTDTQLIQSGKICLFNAKWYDLGNNYDWITNPDTGYKYDILQHWTEVEDLVKDAGDIKFVWEKSRFSYLYTIIRYDYHYNKDHSMFVFSDILDWINKNPINKGPNYKCSQEISIRVLNWIFALYFYKDSPNLNEDSFKRIILYIYWQIRHVYSNINFSRIAVRNNHAITETIALYITGILFPCFPESKKWKKNGKKWFEQEIDYQISKDGAYLQFSMNYHRVVIQLLTWAIAISDINGERFSHIVYEKAYKSVNFLYQCQDAKSGYLPNYGANDGALFFKLNDADYRDYRPQLDALHYLLTKKHLYNGYIEDTDWYTNNKPPKNVRNYFEPISLKYGITSFNIGGYYLIREKDCLTFIRCGKYKDRPSHADNLHIDIWYNGENILLDGGTYKYNTSDELISYFSGTESHNTVMIDKYNQMLKGPRFIWMNWSQALSASIEETDNSYEFNGEISCFTYIKKNIKHQRKIIKEKGLPKWTIIDNIINLPDNHYAKQLWHTMSDKVVINSNPDNVKMQYKQGLYSSLYGIKNDIKQIECVTKLPIVNTVITISEI